MNLNEKEVIRCSKNDDETCYYSDSFESDENDTEVQLSNSENIKKKDTLSLVEKGETLRILQEKICKFEIEDIKIPINLKYSVENGSVMLLFIAYLSIEGFVLAESKFISTIIYGIVLSILSISFSFYYLVNEKVRYYVFNVISVMLSSLQLFFMIRNFLLFGIDLSLTKWMKYYVPGAVGAFLFMTILNVWKKNISFVTFKVVNPSLKTIWIIVCLSLLVYSNFQFFLLIYVMRIDYAEIFNVYFHNIIVWVFHLIFIVTYMNRKIRNSIFPSIIFAFITHITILLPLFSFKGRFLSFITLNNIDF